MEVGRRTYVMICVQTSLGIRVANTWNRLPEKAITSKSVNCFQGRYDGCVCHNDAEEDGHRQGCNDQSKGMIA